MCFLLLKFSHNPSRPVPVPELFGKYPTRPIPKSKTPTRQTLTQGVISSKGPEVWLFEDLSLPRDLDSGPQDSFSRPLGLIC